MSELNLRTQFHYIPHWILLWFKCDTLLSYLFNCINLECLQLNRKRNHTTSLTFVLWRIPSLVFLNNSSTIRNENNWNIYFQMLTNILFMKCLFLNDDVVIITMSITTPNIYCYTSTTIFFFINKIFVNITIIFVIIICMMIVNALLSRGKKPKRNIDYFNFEILLIGS